MNERSVERTVLPNGLTILTERMEQRALRGDGRVGACRLAA